MQKVRPTCGPMYFIDLFRPTTCKFENMIIGQNL